MVISNIFAATQRVNWSTLLLSGAFYSGLMKEAFGAESVIAKLVSSRESWKRGDKDAARESIESAVGQIYPGARISYPGIEGGEAVKEAEESLQRFYKECYHFVPIEADELKPDADLVSDTLKKWEEFLEKFGEELDISDTTIGNSNSDLW